MVNRVEVRRTAEFIGWLSSLRDTKGKVRIDRVAGGNFGDHRSVGEGVSELRMDFGPGYRAYYIVRGEMVVFLLCGGDKDSQDRDIERAKEMAKEIE